MESFEGCAAKVIGSGEYDVERRGRRQHPTQDVRRKVEQGRRDFISGNQRLKLLGGVGRDLLVISERSCERMRLC